MVKKKISRADWAQIESRVKQANFVFDPDWKCLIDGKKYWHCLDHVPEDQHDIIEAVKQRVGV